jgi:hypothetical protein
MLTFPSVYSKNGGKTYQLHVKQRVNFMNLFWQIFARFCGRQEQIREQLKKVEDG